MRRLGALAALAALAAVLAAAAPQARAGGEPAKRLGAADRRVLNSLIDACASDEIGLEEINRNIRKVITIAAGRDEAVEHLIKYGLGHDEALSRLVTVEILACMGGEMRPAGRKLTLAALSEMVEFDDNYTVRRHAARAVAGFGDEPALRKLFREVPDFDGSLRRRIRGRPGQPRPERLKGLGRTISRALERFDSLVRYMEPNVDPDLRKRAVAELQRLTGDRNRVAAEKWKRWWKGRKGVPPVLHRDVNRTADRTYMMALIELAATIEAREAIDGLLAALRHGETTVKMAAANALGQLAAAVPDRERQRAAAGLRAALREPDGWIRASAAKALTACDAQGSVGNFRELLADWAPADRSAAHRSTLARVRRAAIAGLRKAKDADANRELAAILLEPRADRLLKWEVVSALKELGELENLPALARAVASGDARERDHALEATSAIVARQPQGGRRVAGRGEGELITLARGEDPALAVAAISELDRRTGRSAALRDGFLRGLAGASLEARLMAVSLLAHRKWPPAVAELSEATLGGRAEKELALAACRAMAEVGSAEAVAGYLAGKPPSGGALAPLSAGEIKERRRKAVRSLLGLLGSPKAEPEVAAAAADALAVVLPAEEISLRLNVLEALVSALGEGRLREARSSVGSALRGISGEDFPENPKYWRRWWSTQKGGGRRGGGRSGSVSK